MTLKNEPEEKTLNTETEEESLPQLTDEQIRAAALAYARLLREKGLKPGQPIIDEEPAEETEAPEVSESEETEAPEEPEAEAEDAAEEANEEVEAEKPVAEEPKKLTKKQLKAKAEREKKFKAYESRFLKEGGKSALSSVTDFHDKVQDSIDGFFAKVGKDIVKDGHRISDTYTNSRRGIGIALLITGVLAAAILVIFDYFTVYEYAYNGKVLGYVQEQEVVTDVLDVAGRKLSSNSDSDVGIEFVANQNVTFNLVDGREKSTDDADTVVNKLIYMTDIETEAYAVYDGDRVVAIVKDSDSAEALLTQTQTALSTPDAGMELVSSEFINDLAIQPVNVLLRSVQSNEAAMDQMVNGGEMDTYHIVEEGETAESLAAAFGVEVADIYNEDKEDTADTGTADGEEPTAGIEQGDRVCIKSVVEPVSVKMVESGRLREVIEYKTIKEESDEYYQGDTHVKQEGKDQVQVFEGTITKVAGEVTKRKETAETEILKKGQDKIIVVGTKERPKTAPTGTYAMPIEYYTVTSEYGHRWGRLHSGIDLAAPTGTPIYASDGGTVIRAGYYGGYGLCVDIDHENGRVTRYGHCSRIFVSVGDQVYQGENIARVGSTGNSTGPHLHFEVILNGTAHNPRQFINP